MSLKDPSQLPPFSMPSKLLILHGEAKSSCFTVSCVPESMFNCFLWFHSHFIRLDMLGIKYHNQTLVYKQTKGVPDYSGPLKEKDTNGRVRIQSAKKDIHYLITKKQDQADILYRKCSLH